MYIIVNKIFNLLILFTFASCSYQHAKQFEIIVQSDLKNEGFITSDIFQVHALGKPPENSYSILERRENSLKNAYLNALERTIDMIIQERIKEAQKLFPEYEVEMDYNETRIIRNKIHRIIINGNIIQKKFFSDGGCQILYRIQQANLKELLDKIEIKILKKH
jgi:hypothetical protein